MKTKNSDLRRSKSNKELSSKPAQSFRSKVTPKKDHHETSKSSSTSSIIPFINQCIQAEKASNNYKPPLPPPKRPPPPVPRKNSPLHTAKTTPTLIQPTTMIDSHVYDSFQDNSSTTNNHRRTFLCTKSNDLESSTISKSHLLPMRVTDL